jgi:hypothetical protein
MSERYGGSMQNVIESKTHTPGAMEQMLRRIQCEFLQMPGLRLTLAQAERLWNLDALVCESLLSALIDVQFLGRTVDGTFIRRTDTTSRVTRRVA